MSAIAADQTAYPDTTQTRREESSSTAAAGKLYRNSSDATGRAPYVLLDRWGVIQSYVAPAEGVNLEPYLGQQLTVQGTAGARVSGTRLLWAAEVVLPERPTKRQSPATAADRTVKPPARQAAYASAPDQRPVRQVAHQEESDEEPMPPAPAGVAARPTGSAATTHSLTRTAQASTNPARGRDYPDTGYAEQRDLEQNQAAGAAPAPARAARSRYPVRQAQAESNPPSGEGYAQPIPEGSGGGRPCASCGRGAPQGEYPPGPYADGPCSDNCAGPCCPPCGPMCFPCQGSPSNHYWVNTEYLLYWAKGTMTPPLVSSGPSFDNTANGTVTPTNVTPHPGNPGYLFASGTEILYGGARIDDRDRSGGRLEIGRWLDCCDTIGVQGDYLALQNVAGHFTDWSSGDPIVSRPFFDVANNKEEVENVASPRDPNNPQSLDGSITIDSLTEFQSAGVDFRFLLDRCECCSNGWRHDLLVGYRFMRLDDMIQINEDLTTTSTIAPTPGAFVVQDHFDSHNYFNGGEIGLIFARHRGPWSLEFVPKIAIGNVREVVDITGTTRTTNSSGAMSTVQGGLLALSTNIGSYVRDEFAVAPELGLKLGYQVSPHVRATFGYSFLLISNVARAAEQIDINVNPTFLAGSPTAPTGPVRPQFSFQDTAYWAQGLNFGVDFTW
ncbi:MAG: BBP7 family outer membrane beta-barrel protein [Thermoguttaceae bacterium]